jgi:hypothetical protein
MKEKAVAFGANGNLIGVLSEPKTGSEIAGAPAVILWNVGIHHRVGPYRIYVDIARGLAASGLTSLRFDVSGLGDSEPTRNDPRPEQERGIADVQSAMQLLRDRKGIQRFILVAFCSGVDVAHKVAVADPSVAGVAYLEGYRFKTRGFYLRYPLRFLHRERWERMLRVRAPRLFPEQERVTGGGGDVEAVYTRDFPSPEKLKGDISAMVRRGTKLMFVYVGRDSGYTYREQLYEMVDDTSLHTGLHVEYYPDADHILFSKGDRQHVIDDVVRWAERTFGAGAPRAEVSAPRAPLANGNISASQA